MPVNGHTSQENHRIKNHLAQTFYTGHTAAEDDDVVPENASAVKRAGHARGLRLPGTAGEGVGALRI